MTVIVSNNVASLNITGILASSDLDVGFADASSNIFFLVPIIDWGSITDDATTLNVVAGDGTLTGTTGTDGKTNLRADSTNEGLWLENRTSFIKGYSLRWLT